MYKKYIDTINWPSVIDLTKNLIRMESYTQKGKENVLEYAAQYLEGINTKIIWPPEASPYLLAKVSSCKEEPNFTLILEGHLDTVPPGGMMDAFEPKIIDARLYGRGSCDMKAGCASMLLAFKEFAKLENRSGDVYIVLVVDEETESKSIIHALQHYLPKGDLAVVAEPTELNMGIAHKGIEWIQVSISGKSAHASVPDKGINAIIMASYFIQILEKYIADNFSKRDHPICGMPTLTIGSIRGGGDYPNIVPDNCDIKIDRRYNPNENISDVWNDIDECIKLCKNKYPDFQAKWKRIGINYDHQVFPALYFAKDNPMFLKVLGAFKKIEKLVSIKAKGLSYWTEGALLEKFGIPSFIFGPGSIKQAHSSEEFVKTEEIILAAKAYFSLLLDTCLGD